MPKTATANRPKEATLTAAAPVWEGALVSEVPEAGAEPSTVEDGLPVTTEVLEKIGAEVLTTGGTGTTGVTTGGLTTGAVGATEGTTGTAGVVAGTDGTGTAGVVAGRETSGTITEAVTGGAWICPSEIWEMT